MMAIEESNIIVALLDEEGRRNQWVNQEMGYAMAKGIDILAMAESRKELKGFVNMYTKNVIIGNKTSLPKILRRELNIFGEKMAEKIYENIVETQLIKIKEVVNIQHYYIVKLRQEEENPDDKEIIERQETFLFDFEKDIECLINERKENGYFPIANLRTIASELQKIDSRPKLTKKFKTILTDFILDIKNLIIVKEEKYE